MKRLLPIVFMLLLTMSVYADGGYFPPDPIRPMYEPKQEAIIIHNGYQETLIISPQFSGEVNEFAWVVPVPSYPTVEESSRELFYELYRLTAPAYDYGPMPLMGGVTMASQETRDTGIRLHERKEVGIYDTVIMSGYDEDNFMWWFQKEGFAIPDSAKPMIKEYMDKNWIFVVMKIQPEEFEGDIQPIKFEFDTPEPVYPLKISSVNKGASEIILYSFTEHRMQEDDFQVTYASQLTADELVNNYPELNQLLDRSYFLTKMERIMWPTEMTYDIVLGEDVTIDPWTKEKQSQEYIPVNERPFDDAIFYALNILSGILLFIAAVVFRFVFNHFHKKKISIKRALVYGAIILLALNLFLFAGSIGEIILRLILLPGLIIGSIVDIVFPLVGVLFFLLIPIVVLGAIFYALHIATTKLLKK